MKSSCRVLDTESQFPVYLPASLAARQDCCHVDKISCRQLITTVT
jgi:hypothetical protein